MDAYLILKKINIQKELNQNKQELTSDKEQRPEEVPFDNSLRNYHPNKGE